MPARARGRGRTHVHACTHACVRADMHTHIGTGVYGTLAATQGCRVIMYEPQERLHPHIETSIALNGLGDLATLRRAGLSDQPGDC